MNRDPPEVHLLDEFRGYGGRNIPVFTPDGGLGTVFAYPWRAGDYYPGGTILRRHHLHGGGMWMRFQGNVYKAKHLADMRDVELFRAWATGHEGQETEGQVEPVVLLGDQKEHFAARWPFAEAYAQLSIAVARADEVVIAGYGFQDLPVNRVIGAALQGTSIITVVDPDPDIEGRARRALGSQGALRIIHEPLPKGSDASTKVEVVSSRRCTTGVAPGL